MCRMFILHQILSQRGTDNQKNKGEKMVTVPRKYQPMSEKEAEEACKYDYEYDDPRTTKELKRDLLKCLARMR